MIRGVAFCPHPPVLVPEAAQGAASELADLGAGEQTQRHDPSARGSLACFGVDVEAALGRVEPGPVELPLSLTVGAGLVRDALGPDSGATGWTVGPDDAADLVLTGDLALPVMGDGSARRSPSAAPLLDGRAWDAELLYDAAPYGVGYFVAAWTARA